MSAASSYQVEQQGCIVVDASKIEIVADVGLSGYPSPANVLQLETNGRIEMLVPEVVMAICECVSAWKLKWMDWSYLW